ncbi:MAG: HTH-type transcriptional regulator LysM [Sulfolobales archaeon]
MSRISVDDTDQKILSILKKDGRASYREIARSVGLSETAVRKRISNMIRKGIIRRFSVEYVLSDEARALVLVKTTPPTKTPEVAERIRNIEGVEAVYEVTGEHDIAVLVRGVGIGFINRCIDAIRSIEGVVSTYTMIILRAHI